LTKRNLHMQGKENAVRRKESSRRGLAGPGEAMVAFVIVEGAQVGAFVLGMSADGITTPDVPVDA
jgi:hypothetical protein